jgi:rhamnosyltransferase
VSHSDSVAAEVVIHSASIIIRAKNEANLIRQCIEMILAQEAVDHVEILVIDSGSSDGTVDIVNSFPTVRLVRIPESEFNYGRTLNLGVALARHEICVALSAHCIPTSKDWLYNLICHFAIDKNLAGVYGKQIPWPDCEPVERQALLDFYKDEVVIQDHIPQPALRLSVAFSNANSAFRKKLVLHRPFRSLSYAEDSLWASEVINLGYKIRYEPSSVVSHSHNRNVLGWFRVGKVTGYAYKQLASDEIRRGCLLLVAPWNFLSRSKRWYHQHFRHGDPKFQQVCSAVYSELKRVAYALGLLRGRYLTF